MGTEKIEIKNQVEIKVAKLDNLETHIKNFQPRLYENIKKIMYFRSIFMQQSDN